MKGVMTLSVCPLDMGRANSAVYELGGDRAVIIVSALVAIMSSSSSVSNASNMHMLLLQLSYISLFCFRE